MKKHKSYLELYKIVDNHYLDYFTNNFRNSLEDANLNQDNINRFILMCNEHTRSYVVDKVTSSLIKHNIFADMVIENTTYPIHAKIFEVLKRIYIYTVNKF